MTRVIGGRWGGRRLSVPSSGTRPTSDMAREGVFSTLVSLLESLDGMRFLDLYAGSGAVGIEAWSRGAVVTFVESAPKALATVRANVAQFGDPAGVTVIAGKVETVVRELAASEFDVVFADPPYDLSPSALCDAIEALLPLLRYDALVVVERSRRDGWRWPIGLEPIRDRRYGDSTLWYGRVVVPPEDS